MIDAPKPSEPSPLAAISSYDLRHIPDHLAKAGLYDDLHRLLSLEHEMSQPGTSLWPEVRSVNAWYVAAMVGGDLQLYVDHVNVAAAAAREQSRRALENGHIPTAVRHATRYALSAAAVRNVAANMSVRLLTSLVRQGDLAIEQALAYIRQTPDARDRAEGLTTVLEMLGPGNGDVDMQRSVAAEALAAVSAIPDEFWRVGELGRLAENLPADLASQSSSIARTISDVSLRALALSMVGEPIEDELVKSVQGLPYHRKIAATEFPPTDRARYFRAEFTGRRSHAVANLIPFAREDGDRYITSAYWLAESLAALASESDRFRDAAIAAAGRVGGQAAHDALLSAAAAWLTRNGDVDAAMALVAAELKDPSDRLVLTCELAAAGGPSVFVAEVEALADPEARIRAFRSLLPVLSGSERNRAVAAVLMLTADRTPADGLSIVAPHLDELGWRAAVEAAGALADTEERMRVSGELAKRAITLGLEDVPSILDGLLTGIEDRFWYGRAVELSVPPLLDAGHVLQALRLAETSPYPHRRAALLARCANGLTGPGREVAEVSARRLAAQLGSPSSRVRAQLLIAEAYPDGPDRELLDDAAVLASGIEKGVEPVRSSALAAVAVAFASRSQAGRAFGMVGEIADEHWRAVVLESVAAHGDAMLLQAVLEAGRSLRSRGERSRVISAVALRHAVSGSDHLRLHDAWEEALATLASGSREECMHELVPLLPVVAALAGPDSIAWVVAESRTTMRWWE